MDAQATGPVTIDTPLGAGAATFRSGAQVKLGSGSGSSASASDSPQSSPQSKKPIYIRTKILRNGEPAKGVSYQLVLNGGKTLSGSTTGEGMIEQQVPPTVTLAVLTLQDTGETHALVIGAIEPPTSVTGAQLRLHRLGFYQGAIDGDLGELTEHALLLFQKAQGLSATGRLDSATQSALKTAYGS
jgi:hypothetical protein